MCVTIEDFGYLEKHYPRCGAKVWLEERNNKNMIKIQHSQYVKWIEKSSSHNKESLHSYLNTWSKTINGSEITYAYTTRSLLHIDRRTSRPQKKWWLWSICLKTKWTKLQQNWIISTNRHPKTKVCTTVHL